MCRNKALSALTSDELGSVAVGVTRSFLESVAVTWSLRDSSYRGHVESVESFPISFFGSSEVNYLPLPARKMKAALWVSYILQNTTFVHGAAVIGCAGLIGRAHWKKSCVHSYRLAHSDAKIVAIGIFDFAPHIGAKRIVPRRKLFLVRQQKPR